MFSDCFGHVWDVLGMCRECVGDVLDLLCIGNVLGMLWEKIELRRKNAVRRKNCVTTKKCVTTKTSHYDEQIALRLNNRVTTKNRVTTSKNALR